MQPQTNRCRFIVLGIALFGCRCCVVDAFSSPVPVIRIRSDAQQVPWQPQPPRVTTATTTRRFATQASDSDSINHKSDSSELQDSDNDDTNSNNAFPRRHSRSSSRAGGRAVDVSKTTKRPERSEGSKTKKNGLIQWALPLLALVWIAFQAMFGGGSNSSYVFYQSSLYESRSYSADGQVQTVRKESIKSNLPGLLENKRANRDELDQSSSYYSSGETFDRNLDREIDREIHQSMRLFQPNKITLDDFFE